MDLVAFGGCGHASQSEFGGSTSLVASACWDQMLCPPGPQVPTSPRRDGRFGRMYNSPCPLLSPADHDVGARPCAWAHSIHIMKVEEITASRCPPPSVKQFHDSKINFRLPHQVLHCQHKPCFTTKRPNTFFYVRALPVPRSAQIKLFV